MIKHLLGQSALCILYSLPIPTMMSCGGGHFVLMGYYLVWFIPMAVFLFVMVNDDKCKFMSLRVIIAALLWGLFGECREYIHGEYSFRLAYWVCHTYGVEIDHWNKIYAALFAIYNAIAITIVVVLSYVIGSLINSMINGKPSA